MSRPFAIAIEGVRKSFDGHEALKGVDLAVPEGSVFGLLGPNGAGKTTLIRMLTGITAPDSGRIAFFGEPWHRDHIRSIGYLPEERGLYKNMRVGEQAMYFARLRGLGRSEAEKRLRSWFERLEVDGWWNREVGELSKGMAQKIQFITTVLHEPRLLILDEPLSGFDPINAQRIRDVILELRKNLGTTILLSTHDMSSVEELCDEVALLNHGNQILSGPVDALREKARGGRYRIGFEGTVLGFTVDIGSSAKLENVTTHENKHLHEAHIVLPPETDVAEWLRSISATQRVVSFTPWHPSMREVFIHAVENTVA